MKHIRSALAAAFVLCLPLGCSSDSTTTPPVPVVPLAVGDITTWAGTGRAGFDGDGHDALHTRFYWPMDIEFTPHIGTFVSDWNNHRIRKLDGNGRFRTIIGISIPGDGPTNPPGADFTSPGVPGTDCGLNHPTQVFERINGKLLVVCWHNHKLREWDPATGDIMVISGRGPGCTGDGSLASSPTVTYSQPPHAVEAPDGTLYINDQRNECIRKIDPSGVVSTVVSTPHCQPTADVFPPGAFGGDDGPPASADINQPTGSNPNPPGGGVALDSEGRLYIADTLNHRIRRVDFDLNVITTVAGDGVAGYGGDGGDPLLASLNVPLDIAFGPDGRLYIADMNNDRIRAVDFANNVITTVAGNGVRGFSGDGGPATSAQLNQPYGIGFDAGGDLYIADTYNHRIRRVKMHD